jgi:hypothetical protein
MWERGRLGGIRERSQKKEKAFLLKEIILYGYFFQPYRWIFLFMAVMGDRRMAAGVKTALYGIEFSRESSVVSIRWDA